MSEPKGCKPRYKTTNRPAYNAALTARGSLTIWLDKDMQWYAPAIGKRGRQPIFSDAAIEFCLSIKCLFGLALRQSLVLNLNFKRVMARTFERQVTELHARVALLNRFTQLGCPITVPCRCRGVAASGLGVISACFWFVQQSLPAPW